MPYQGIVWKISIEVLYIHLLMGVPSLGFETYQTLFQQHMVLMLTLSRSIRYSMNKGLIFTSLFIKTVKMSAFGTTVYNLLFRRTSTFTLTILVGAVFFERAFDHGADALWERMNRGVSKNSK